MHRPRLNHRKDYESKIGQMRVDKKLRIKDLCRLANITSNIYGGFQNGMLSPVHVRGNSAGTIKPSAQRVIDILDCTLGQAFPAYSCDIDRRELTDDQQLEITMSEASMLPTREDRWNNFHDVLYGALMTLSPKERLVLQLRFFKNKTLFVVANLLGVQGERVRQIEGRALRKLSHPGQHDRLILKEFWNGMQT